MWLLGEQRRGAKILNCHKTESWAEQQVHIKIKLIVHVRARNWHFVLVRSVGNLCGKQKASLSPYKCNKFRAQKSSKSPLVLSANCNLSPFNCQLVQVHRIVSVFGPLAGSSVFDFRSGRFCFIGFPNQ